MDYSHLVIDLSALQPGALRTLPSVPIMVKTKSSGIVTIGALMRMPCQPFEQGSNQNQKYGIRAREERFHMELTIHFNPSTGSVISVKRRASGSSSVVRGTVWRMPNQVR